MARKSTDFSEIVSKLNEWGFTDYKLEELTGIGRTRFTKLRKGGSGGHRQPNYDDGCAIMEIYQREAKKQK